MLHCQPRGYRPLEPEPGVDAWGVDSQGAGKEAWGPEAPGGSAHQHGDTRDHRVLLNPFYPFSTPKVLALKATVLLLLTLLIKARVQIAAGSTLGILLLLLQTLVFLAISGGLVLAACGAAVYATQRRRPATA